MLVLLMFILGAAIGSFLNVVIIRLPKGHGINGRSHCPRCQTKLRARDLVPIISYLVLGGRCRTCSQRIPSRYLLVEAVTGILFVMIFAIVLPQTGTDWLFLARDLFIVSTLLVVFMVDAEHMLILNSVVLPASIGMLLFNLLIDYAVQPQLGSSLVINGLLSALGAAAVFGIIYLVSNGRWMGFGDVKYAVFLGLATPYPYIVVTVVSAFILGGLVGTVLILTGVKRLRSQIAFGTFLSVGAFIALFWGSQLVLWYLRLIGVY